MTLGHYIIIIFFYNHFWGRSAFCDKQTVTFVRIIWINVMITSSLFKPAFSAGLSFPQPLIGTTTFTPTLSLSGMSRKADTVDVAQSFVAAPTRINVGASLKADFYGCSHSNKPINFMWFYFVNVLMAFGADNIFDPAAMIGIT